MTRLTLTGAARSLNGRLGEMLEQERTEPIDSDDSAAMVSNLAELSVLNEETLLRSLQERYAQDEIYTNVGEILLALNPFCPLAIYGRRHQRRYGVDDGQESDSWERRRAPHIYDVARRAYGEMMAHKRHQVCVISGESGAGKTESSKFVIRQVSQVVYF